MSLQTNYTVSVFRYMGLGTTWMVNVYSYDMLLICMLYL